jgi:hypothetical protein
LIKSGSADTAPGDPGFPVIGLIQAADDNPGRGAGMNKPAIFQINPDMIDRSSTPFPDPEKDQVTFPKLAPAYSPAITGQYFR